MTGVPAMGLVLGRLLVSAAQTGWLWVGFRFARFLVRPVIGEDQVAMDSKGVTWRQWRGPGSEVHHLPYSDVAAFPEPVGSVTALLHTGKVVELASVGELEHEALWKRLCGLSELGVTPKVLTACVPEGREAIALPEGGVVLRREWDGGIERAWALGGVVLLLLVSAAVVMWRQGIDGATVEGPLFAVALVGFVGWVGLKACPSFQSRREWEIRPGVLEKVRYRIGRPIRVNHGVKSLEVRQDETGELGTPEWVYSSLFLNTPKGPVRLERGSASAQYIQHLGQWLAHRLKVPLNVRAIQDELPKVKSSRRCRTG
ncbi:hypothetical protein [Myxococcus eversor]|uniref:hypothetical protein n=1 Tax=Myxococcus eversor TaxID=2709661 RepID=UPI0013D0F434|nr:hypothetical protein [Myxococcus eversor]